MSRSLRSNSNTSSPVQKTPGTVSASSPMTSVTLAGLRTALDDSFKEMDKRFNDILEKSLEKLRMEIRNDFQAQIAHLESIIASQAAEIENLKSCIETVSDVDSKLNALAVSSHRLMRKEIETNVIVSGIPEDEVINNNSGLFAGVLSKLECPFSEISSFARVGKASGLRPRLLKISFSNTDLRIKAVKNAKLLREDSRFKGVFVNPDLTFAERLEQKRLRDKAREIRTLDSRARVILRHGKLIVGDDVVDVSVPHRHLFRDE